MLNGKTLRALIKDGKTRMPAITVTIQRTGGSTQSNDNKKNI